MSTTDKTRTIGDYVSYRRNGVCRIVDITTENFGRLGKKQYYVLNSVYDKNVKVFVPIGSEIEKEMKTLPTKGEVKRYIKNAVRFTVEWTDDAKRRASYFETLMTEGDRSKIVALLIKLRDHRAELEKTGKKLKANDTKYFLAAETLITGEFGFVLDIPRNQVLGYIDSCLPAETE